MKIGDKVKTNRYYIDSFPKFFSKEPIEIKEAVIQFIRVEGDHLIAEVKTRNGKARSINMLFLETI